MIVRKAVGKPTSVKASGAPPIAAKTVAAKTLRAKPAAKLPLTVKKAAGKKVAGKVPGTNKAPTKKPVVKKPVVNRAATKAVALKPASARPLPAKAARPKPASAKRPIAKAIPAKIAPPARPVALLPVGAERKAIQAKYDAMSLLVMRRDGKRLAALLMGMTTPDFVYRDKKGRAQNRAKLVGDLRAQMKMVSKFKRSGNRVAALALRGSGGTARVISDFAMVFPNGKKWVTVVGQSTTDDVWVKTAAGWKLKSIRTLKENVKYNGKPM